MIVYGGGGDVCAMASPAEPVQARARRRPRWRLLARGRTRRREREGHGCESAANERRSWTLKQEGVSWGEGPKGRVAWRGPDAGGRDVRARAAAARPARVMTPPATRNPAVALTAS